MKRWIIGLLMVARLHAGEAEALQIDSDIRNRHMPYLMIMDPMFESATSTNIVGYTRCGDSAIWTGHYLAAESYRWAVTRSPEAKQNVMDALNGIRKLLDVTGVDVLARCAVPADSDWAAGIMSEESQHGIRSGVVDGQSFLWVGNTSRDQYVGVFFGLTAAWNLVDDQLAHDWVSMLATRMLNNLQDHAWSVTMPEGDISTTFLARPDQQLSLLKLGRRCNPDAFEGAYKILANGAGYTAVLPISLEVEDPYNSYFKFNLDHITFYDLLTSGDNSFVRQNYVNAFDVLRKTTDDHANPFFDIIDTAINGRTEQRDANVRTYLSQWLQRDRRDNWVDLRPVYPSCGGDENRSCTVIPVAERPPTDFLWQRSPFQLYGGLYGTIEGAGIDYILPYWMARYYGVVGQIMSDPTVGLARGR